jgi:hypothetical protein
VVLVVSASVLSYNLGRSSTINEVITTTSISTSTVSTIETITSTTTTAQSSITTTTTATITSTTTTTTTAKTTSTIMSTTTSTTTAKTTATITTTVLNATTITKVSTTTTTVTSTTSSAAGGVSFRFVVMGDSRGDASSNPVNTGVLSGLTGTAAGFNPAFMLFTGDLCYDFSAGNCPSLWKSTVNSNLLSKTVPIMGNHDAGDNTLWQNNFNIAAIVASFGGTNYQYRSGQASLDFSFDYGNSHFIGLAVTDDVSSTRPSSTQLNWLDTDLTNAEKTGCGGTGCTSTFIFFHAPVYCASTTSHCSPPPTPPSGWTTVTNAHHSIVATFSGHEHILAYTHINSDRISDVSTNMEYEEFIIGDAGAPPYQCGSRADWCESNYGFAVVDVSGTTVTVNVYDMNGASLHSEWVFKVKQ